ncbi:hypothetical protein J6590_073413 [Homalodisca vitripennis]|nr:hypothetical protein J6590_073413 [Homalodisca vitripennis]
MTYYCIKNGLSPNAVLPTDPLSVHKLATLYFSPHKPLGSQSPVVMVLNPSISPPPCTLHHSGVIVANASGYTSFDGACASFTHRLSNAVLKGEEKLIGNHSTGLTNLIFAFLSAQYLVNEILRAYRVEIWHETSVVVRHSMGYGLSRGDLDAMVDACHRLGRQTGDNPPGIIIKFVRRFDKEELLKKRRVKRTLSIRHIGRSDDRPIYVNESLSPARRRLYAMARRVQKEKDLKFLWVRNGKIFLRKEENSPIKVITCQDDLQ